MIESTNNKHCELVLHVGYPKTATTSFQNAVFFGLHNNNFINYIGISKPSVSECHFKNKDIINRALSGDENAKNKLKILFDSGLINVYSDENIISRTAYERLDETANNIFKLFKFIKLVQVVIVIRNQQDLLYSLYVHQGGHYTRNKLNTSDKFIDYYLKSETGSLFCKYDKVADVFSNFFGKENVNILLFEDFLHAKNKHFLQWSQILKGVPVQEIYNCLGNKHFYKKNKHSSGSYYCGIRNRLYYFKKYAMNFHTITLLNNMFNKCALYKKLKNSIAKKERTEMLIPKFSEHQNSNISEIFYDSNNNLASKYDLDRNALANYGYLKK